MEDGSVAEVGKWPISRDFVQLVVVGRAEEGDFRVGPAVETSRAFRLVNGFARMVYSVFLTRFECLEADSRKMRVGRKVF